MSIKLSENERNRLGLEAYDRHWTEIASVIGKAEKILTERIIAEIERRALTFSDPTDSYQYGHQDALAELANDLKEAMK